MKGKYFFMTTLTLLAMMIFVGCVGDKGEQEQPLVSGQPANQQKQIATLGEEETGKQSKQTVFIASADRKNCADCHSKISEGKDHSLTTALAKVENHPEITSEDVAYCASCHEEDSKNSMPKILHSNHYAEGSHFTGIYAGSCVHCHKLTENGTLPVAGLELEGTNFVPIEVASIDEAPKGCLDCHQKISEEKDYSLNVSIAKIEGHTQMRMTGPADCLSCHESGTNKAFGPIMHKKHLLGEHYKDHGNSCLNCHDGSNRMAIKGL